MKMLKHELRKLFLEKRRKLSKGQKAQFDHLIKSAFQKLFPDDAKCVHIYLPIRSKNEIDTWPIIQELWSNRVEVAVPVTHPVENRMNSTLLTPATKLKESKWGVPEPVFSKEIKNSEIDVVVLPLLAFDRQGYRIGYGQGFYDQFLSSFRKDVIKIGLSYFLPIERITDRGPWDIPMDSCITPEKVFKF